MMIESVQKIMKRQCFALLLLCLSTTTSLFVSATTSTSVAQPKAPPEVFRGKICIGTTGRMSVPSNRNHHYRNLKDRYSNCTYVEGNLELTWIQEENMDLSFLQHIREVTGYLLISHVDVKRIVLPSLQVIRGRTLFRLNVHDDEFALMVTLSRMDNLELPALRDVLAGNVGVFNNYNLCHVKTINWDEIISGPNSRYVYVYNFTQPERQCPPCDHSCEAGCWGEGHHNCQKFSKINCSPQCHEGRCYGPEPRECCHLSCAGGCTGPKKSDCLACKKFYDDGECKDECPSLVIYNPNTYLSERNPGGKYAYGATCVKTCPEHLLRDAGAGACVRQCPPDKEAHDGECVPCNGPCRKKCQGPPPPSAIVHSGNIESFRNCTIIEGSLAILETSFGGFQEVHPNFTFGERYKPMDPSQLEVFSTLKEVAGYVNIQATHPNFTNLSYFRNLENIGGREKTDFFASLYIVKTSLRSLNLRSLKRIRSGAVAILENPKLCFSDTINWKKIMNGKAEEQVFNNSNTVNCRKLGDVCSTQCSVDGCWGPEPNDCLSCAKFKLGDSCIPNCNSTIGIYEDSPGVCKHCHEQCESTCFGSGPGNCTKCKNVKDGPFCVESCPESKYKLGRECISCHENCIGGCTGPANTIGPNGCKSCSQAIVNEFSEIERCLGKDEPCPEGYYYESVGPKEQGLLKAMGGKSVCKKCHTRCKKCSAFGFHTQVCQECAQYRRGEQCEEECPSEFYADQELKECLPCDEACRGCSGNTTADCVSCRNYRIYPDGDTGNELNSSFVCTLSCPPEFPHRQVPAEDRQPFCSQFQYASPSSDEPTSAIVVGTVVCFIILAIFATILGLYCVKAKTKENTFKMTLGMMHGYGDSEPLQPTNVKPNLSKFRTVKEEELRKGGILGCGAFGTVYKGVWIPEGQNVKIPVAIKVLREGTGVNTSKDFLDEAYIMASVEHPHLLKLLAVCLTSQLMLVTQLMPLGCLRDYVHNNKDKIGSKALLNYCVQIAKGMEYLESKRLVHRDLAARNVLVQTPTFVKITDFGLAKLLEIDEDEYKAEGGKMPIKWLGIECIRDRTFTHKSDVWAFGVTVWELLTYGGRPYENIPAREVPELLMKGERLEQPPICTLELYMTIIKCWMVDPEARPGFVKLVEEFTKMSRDPGRYLVIPGDKLMRLPSYSQQDERELIRNLSSAMEGPEVIMDAEEYLQPRSNGTTTTSSSSTNGTLKTNTYLQDNSWPDSPQNFRTRLRDRRYGRGNPDLSDTRYCSDPLKVLGRDTSDGYSTDSIKTREAQVGNIRLDLPVDDDDYLMPSPQTNQNASAYLDLIGDSKGLDGNPSELYAQYGRYRGPRRNNPHNHPHFHPTLVDNPEYQLVNREYTNMPQMPPHTPEPLAYAPIGLPMAPTTNSSTSSSSMGAGVAAAPGNHSCAPAGGPGPVPVNNYAQPPSFVSNNLHRPNSIVRHSSRSEEESDHEYYNDLDRLKREMQPLQQLPRKSETTV